MKKFAVFSGFLGSGKTTTMMALTEYYTENSELAAMISNDLGHLELADNKYAQLSGIKASELVGECICYQTENLVARLDRLFDEEDCELVISDIPGFGVGALEHVYHTLEAQYTGRYDLAPFTVLVEPRTLEMLESDSGGDLEYILRTQLVEADLIVLNKCDLLSESQQAEKTAWLAENFPQAELVAISALNGQGIDRLAQALRNGKASLRRPDIGYGGEAFMAAMGKISEYYVQYFASVCCDNFDGNAYLAAIAGKIGEALCTEGGDMPHLKLLAWEPEGDYAKADYLGIERPLEFAKYFSRPCTELAVMLNGSAVCPGDKLEALMQEAVETVSQKFNLTVYIHKKECFGMGQ